jgi:hypothetical protein
VITDILEENVISIFRVYQSKMNLEDRSSTLWNLPVVVSIIFQKPYVNNRSQREYAFKDIYK